MKDQAAQITQAKVLDGVPGPERADAAKQLRTISPELRARVLERVRNLESAEDNRPTRTKDHVEDALVRVVRAVHDEAPDLTREQAIAKVQAGLAA